MKTHNTTTKGHPFYNELSNLIGRKAMVYFKEGEGRIVNIEGTIITINFGNMNLILEDEEEIIVIPRYLYFATKKE